MAEKSKKTKNNGEKKKSEESKKEHSDKHLEDEIKEVKEEEEDFLEGEEGKFVESIDLVLQGDKTPVLEQVAVASGNENLEHQLALARNLQQRNENEEETNYANTTSENYADVRTTNHERGNIQYMEATHGFRTFPDDKEHKETRRRFNPSDYYQTGAGKENRGFEQAINPEIEGTDETKKYITRDERK